MKFLLIAIGAFAAVFFTLAVAHVTYKFTTGDYDSAEHMAFSAIPISTSLIISALCLHRAFRKPTA